MLQLPTPPEVASELCIPRTSRGKEPLLPGFGEAVVRLYKAGRRASDIKP